METEEPFKTSQEILDAARQATMDPDGVVDVARRLSPDVAMVREAIAAALDNDESHVATLIALAAGTNEMRIRSGDVRELLVNLPDARFIPVIVSIVRDDRLKLVLDVLENIHLGAEDEATLMAVATILLDGAPAPTSLLARIRTLGRQELPVMVGAMVVLAAEACGDDDARKVASRWGEAGRRVAGELHSAIAQKLEGPPTSHMPIPTSIDVPRPDAPRTVTKVGRNDPCPCGSGKKYKKCCASKVVEAAAESEPAIKVPTAGELDRALAPADPTDVLRLSLNRLARLEFDALSSLKIIQAVRRLGTHRHWEAAARAMEVLDRRTDLPMGAHSDEYREELIHGAIDAGAADVVQFHVSKLTTDAAREGLALKLAVLEPGRDSLAVLDRVARQGLGTQARGHLVDLAHAILGKFPALGIIVARGALDHERDFDSGLLLERIEEARDVLGLPPGDAAADIYDALLDRKAGEEEKRQLKGELEAERRRAREARDELRQGLRDASRNVADLQRQLAEVQQASAKPADSGGQADDGGEARTRLKEKVEELKARVADGQRERADLRRKLEQALTARETDGNRAPKATENEDSLAESDAHVEVSIRQRVRIPVFADRVQAALSTVPKPVAAQAVKLAGELAAGDEAAWRSVKRLHGVVDLLAVRIGIHHRLLFRVPKDESALSFVELVTREDLLTTLKPYR